MAAVNQVIDRDHGWRELARRAQALTGGAYAKVGVLADSSRGGLHQVGKDGKAAALTVAEIAAVLEYGTENGSIPARPFLRMTFDAMQPELIAASRKLIVRVVLDGDMSADAALNVLGLMLATGIRNTITQSPLPGVAPPNAPSTMLAKAKKGRTGRFFKRPAGTLGAALAQAGALASVRTLVDTGRLVGAISWAVVFPGTQLPEHYVGGGGA